MFRFVKPAITLLLILGTAGLAPAHEKPVQAPSKGEALPKDKAILEIDVPPGTKVTVDGAVTSKLQWLISDIVAGRRIEKDVTAHFNDGSVARRRVFLQGGWHVRLPLRRETGRPELFLRIGHTNTVSALAFSPDNRYVVTGSDDTLAILWDAASGNTLRTFAGHTGGIKSVSFSPDGRQVLTGSADKTAVMWDTQSGQKLRTFHGHSKGVWSAAFGADGQQVLTGSLDKTAILWDVKNGQRLRTLQGHGFGVTSVALSTSGPLALTGSQDGTAILWDTASGQRLRTFQGHKYTVNSVVFGPDGRRMLTASEKTIILWDVHTGGQLRSFHGHKNYVESARFSPDGGRMVSACRYNVILWDVETGQQIRNFAEAGRSFHSAVFSPHGRLLLTGAYRAAKLWDLDTGQQLRTFAGSWGSLNSAVFSPDGRHALIALGVGQQWDLETGRQSRAFVGVEGSITSITFSRDGRKAVLGRYDKAPILWDVQVGKELRVLPDTRNRVVSLSPDGRQVLTGTRGTTAIIWDADTGETLRTFQHKNFISAGAFSPDGRQFATGTDHTAILWDATTGQKLQSFQENAHSFIIYSIAFSPDGRQMLTGSGFQGRTAVLWDVQSGQKLRTFQHNGSVNSVAFSPDGRQVLTASKDGTAALWEPQTGHKLRSFQGHSGEVNSAYSNPDGRLVLTCGFDCTARLWDVATGDELVRFPSLDVGSKSTPKEAPKDTDWLVITPHGLFDGSEGGRQKVNYRIGGGLNIVPVDRFFQDFYRPGLFTALWRGERPMPSVELGTARAPVVRILSPKQAGVVEQPQAELDVEAVNQGGGIKEPWLFHNGARVLDRNPAERTEKSIKRKFHVQLLPGENKLEVFSASGDGSWESEPAVLTLRYEKPLPKPNLYLVAVGVSRYAEASYKLQFARKDAKTLAELFDRRGKALYEAVHVTTLLDEDATGKRIRETMDDLAKKAQPQDTLLLFLAGHGAMVGQRYYFIPHDFKINAGAGRDDDIRKQGMPADVLADFLVKGQARRRLLILDTCASGGTVDLFQVAVRDPFALRGEVERLVHSQGLYVLAASAATEQAQEPAALGHGVLSYALLAGLRGVDKGPLERLWVQPNNPNQVVDVLEWFNFAEQHVRRLSRDQHVHMGARGSNFPVLPLGER